MREIALDESPSKLPTYSFLLYGPTRTGKTHFAATLPRPYIYADVTESGYKTIQTMDRSTWFEPEVKPIVVGVTKMNDFAQDRERLKAMIAAGLVLTVVVDAFSFYADFFLAELQRNAPSKDNRQIYGDLGKHLREVRQNFGLLGVNVVYLCLEKPPDTDDPIGKPLIPGQQAGKFAAGVDFLWHTRVHQTKSEGKIVNETRERRTRQHGAYIAGNRLGAMADLLPDPFTGTYSDLLECLGCDVELMRNSLKPYDDNQRVKLMAQAAAATVPAAKPPAVAAKPAAPVARPAQSVAAKPNAAPVARPATPPVQRRG